MPSRITSPFLLLLAFILPLAAPVAAQTTKLALVGGLLIDGSGGEPLANSIVLINGSRIESVGTVGRMSVPPDYLAISTEGMTVLPGLWDLHVHLLYSGHPDFNHWFDTYPDQFRTVTIPASAQQFLMAGVTSVRDLAITTDDVFAVKQGIQRGELIGPAVYTAGAALMPGAGAARPHLLPVAGAADASAKTTALIDRGVDFVKVLGATAASQAEMNAIVATAHAAGVRVTAHGRSDEELRVALLAGVDEIQHIGTGGTEYPADIIELIRARIASGVPLYWNPTIGLTLNADELAADPEWLQDPKNFAGLTPAIAQDVRQAIANHQFTVPTVAAVSAVRRKLQQLNELGVIMVSGSDMGTFGHPASEATWRELEAWVFELGMSPLQALKWATADAAAYMGVADQVGTLTPGKLADVIAVKGSPLRHFSTLREPAIVIRNGVRYK
jgi:imidazolonepropionase-like amidohydrolase